MLLSLHLAVGSVATNGLGTVKVRIDTGVELVQHVAVMRARRSVTVSAANSSANAMVASVSTVSMGASASVLSGTMSTCNTRSVSSVSIAIRVNTRVSLICQV